MNTQSSANENDEKTPEEQTEQLLESYEEVLNELCETAQEAADFFDNKRTQMGFDTSDRTTELGKIFGHPDSEEKLKLYLQKTTKEAEELLNKVQSELRVKLAQLANTIEPTISDS